MKFSLLSVSDKFSSFSNTVEFFTKKKNSRKTTKLWEIGEDDKKISDINWM
jgi:hypothetical protein